MSIPTVLIRGSAQLLFDGVSGITTAAQGMHQTIAGNSTFWLKGLSDFRPLKEIRNPTAYSVVRATSDVLNKAVGKSLALIHDPEGMRSLDRKQLAWVAALNGVCGDHLEDTNNVLAIPMAFTGESVANPHIVVMVHGLCLSEQCWQPQEGPGLGAQLQKELGMTPVFLRYNSGRSIPANGKELSRQLDDLLARWPVPVESLSLVGHSMGGLLIRSAARYAQLAKRPWLKPLKRILYLGSPHHGSPVEKAGHILDSVMQSIKHVQPLAFGRKRSAGIKDLRHGNLVEEDWAHLDGEEPCAGERQDVPLLPRVDHYFIAASVGRDERDLKGLIIGDFLVRVGSALGNRSTSAGWVDINEEHCRVFQEKNHFDLLIDERVHEQVVDWFRTPPAQSIARE